LKSKNEESVRAFFRAVEENDFETLGRLVSGSYIWIDHTVDFIARSPEELIAAKVEDEQWSDREFVIDRAMETADGTVVVQLTVTQTLTGVWRSVKGTGQRVRREIVEIFQFDPEGRIIVEEMYEDCLALMQQLGALPSPAAP
jgi:hypothetical protein